MQALRFLPVFMIFVFMYNDIFPQIIFENKGSYPVSIAIAYYESGKKYSGWYTKGWYNIDPNEKITPFSKFSGQTIYYYAEIKVPSKLKKLFGSGYHFSGSTKMLVHPKDAFEIKNPSLSTTKSQNSEYKWEKFIKQSVESGSTNFVFSFDRCLGGGDCKNGKGDYFYDNGVYKGEWKEGKRHGKGTYKRADGRTWKGDWLDNKAHGFVEYTQIDNYRYYGEYKYYKRNGLGQAEWWIEDSQSTLAKAGDKYIGEWQESVFGGWGVLYRANGRVESGVWKDGKTLVKAISKEEVLDYLEIRYGSLLAKVTGQQSEEDVSASPKNSRPIYQESDVDKGIPNTSLRNAEGIAVVIGNTSYEKTKKVSYAIHDAETVKKYLVQSMGFREDNIFYIEDATKSDFETLFGIRGNPRGKLYNALKPGISDVFVFYSGHGAPGLHDKEGYFLPVNCDPQYVELGAYPLSVFYENLAQLPANEINVVLDACFSGATIFENISPVKIKTNTYNVSDNLMVLSSSTDDQVSGWYNEKEHGLFSYFFLKAIHDKNADSNRDNQLSFTEIVNYVSDPINGVPYYAKRLHGIEQTPQIQGINKQRVLVEYK